MSAVRAALLLVGLIGLAVQAQDTGIQGLVTSTTSPVAGVTVQAFRAGEATAATTTKTGADGRYRLTGLTQGVYRVEFAAADFGPQTRAGIVVFEKSLIDLDVVLVRTGAGTVADSSQAAGRTSALRPGEVGVRIETSLGSISLAIDTVHAPITASNFLKYVDGGFYDGGQFHRATRPDNYTPTPPNRPAMEIIQGGINPDRRAAGFPPIPLERTSVTGLKHVRGVVSMARGAADTATSDFFILIDDQPSLDFGGKRFDDAQGAAAFGRVIDGMDVVRRIQQQPVKGQNLTPPIPIISVKRF